LIGIDDVFDVAGDHGINPLIGGASFSSRSATKHPTASLP